MAENKGVIEAWVDRNGNKWWFPIVMTSLIFLFFPPFWIFIHYLIVVKN
jgi:hypothetical protein